MRSARANGAVIAQCILMLATGAAYAESGWLGFTYDIAGILPLPGQFAGYGESKEGWTAVFLKPGKDPTKQILTPESPPSAPKPSDIFIRVKGPAYVEVTSEEGLPFRMGVLGRSPATIDLLGAVKSGRTIRVARGSFTLSIADESTKEALGEVKYEFGDHATICWNATNKRLVWRGFNASVKPASDKKEKQRDS